MHIAAGRGHQEMVALLLDHPGIDETATTNRGFTVLHMACYRNCGPDILRRLLTNPDVDPDVKNINGETAIMLLLRRNQNMDNHGDSLRAMVESDKVDLEVKDPYGRSLEDLVR